ncbi:MULTISPECIES: cobyric acid synthase [unclassified Sporosarcina]|uniref:cobyric acid synthase n=1 Tax=unclassified Sporosarcina TaxID=2647733 RepID=UPI00203C33D2|nr:MULTISPECIES: cobyric acid synthase [unclassified Sporosarcina]GKV65372.1 cobyric acid synthase [Sporosarcina sp. NCCP-2331]GLB55496.1 cobyric acid synthase [Sporosarcina sp. NCCP-2378]
MKAIMIQGTASDVGKSVLCTALCRILVNDGYRIAPFKSQNMALNSYITKDGGEIGRAQGVQAEAAKIDATTDMNPILLKPTGNMVSEVILHGKPFADMDAVSYRENFVEQVMPEVRKSLRRLEAQYDVLVLEGAGSPAEINLKKRDIANMRMAHETDAAVILVADIERGGVFASLVGTLMLLDDEERARVKGIIINKFRGMRELLDSGIDWLEEYTGIQVLGVIPYFDVQIEAEDSMALSSLRLKKPHHQEFAIDVAVIRFPLISNFTDLDPLFEEPDVGVRFVSSLKDLKNPDVIILPGTKNTIDDYIWLKETGLADEIAQLSRKGKKIVGICGGYQMLGETIIDKQAVDNGRKYDMLGLLPVETVFIDEQQTVQVEGTNYAGQAMKGFEIRLGHSTATQPVQSFIQLHDGRQDGVYTEQTIGTYVHGVFQNRIFTRDYFNKIRVEKGLEEVSDEILSDYERREQAYEMLDHHVRKHLNMEKIYELIDGPMQQ